MTNPPQSLNKLPPTSKGVIILVKLSRG